jgi:hypothetical protein
MFETLVEALDIEKSTLIFTNTRNQSERWYQALNFALPEEADRIALHHGSIDVKEREAIEAGVKSGDIKWVGLYLIAGSRRRFSAGGAGGADRQRQKSWRGCCSGRGVAPTCRKGLRKCSFCLLMPWNCSKYRPFAGD